MKLFPGEKIAILIGVSAWIGFLVSLILGSPAKGAELQPPTALTQFVCASIVQAANVAGATPAARPLILGNYVRGGQCVFAKGGLRLSVREFTPILEGPAGPFRIFCGNAVYPDGRESDVGACSAVIGGAGLRAFDRLIGREV